MRYNPTTVPGGECRTLHAGHSFCHKKAKCDLRGRYVSTRNLNQDLIAVEDSCHAVTD